MLCIEHSRLIQTSLIIWQDKILKNHWLNDERFDLLPHLMFASAPRRSRMSIVELYFFLHAMWSAVRPPIFCKFSDAFLFNKNEMLPTCYPVNLMRRRILEGLEKQASKVSHYWYWGSSIFVKYENRVFGQSTIGTESTWYT